MLTPVLLGKAAFASLASRQARCYRWILDSLRQTGADLRLIFLSPKSTSLPLNTVVPITISTTTTTEENTTIREVQQLVITTMELPQVGQKHGGPLA